LAAATEQLLARGYEGLSVSEVAESAGVALTTVYRRWPTKADLAAAVVGDLAAVSNPLPDTGTLEGDLSRLLAQILELLRRPEVERIVRAATTLPASVGGAVEARNAFFQARTAGSAQLVSRAIARGELPADTDPEVVIEFLVGPAYLRLLLSGRPLDDALLAESVQRTLAAFRG
jgi:AcrR family transcriptional regulator